MVPKIINLNTYRTESIVKKGFDAWRLRFAESFSETTKLSDVSDSTVLYLAQPGDNSTTAFYELIMGTLAMGTAPNFYYLPNADQLKVVDIHLFLADQVRFEMMKRLGWLDRYPGQPYPLIMLVLKQRAIKADRKKTALALSRAYPEYQAYCALTQREQESFIRCLLPKALETFSERIQS
jgi:hypothetical protein